MKEVEKNEIKRLSDRLDAIRHQPGRSVAGWSRRQICRTGKRESHAGSRNCSPARSSQPETQQRSAETDEDAVPACNHQKRASWYGQTEKSVRGLVVVHPMTALGREMGLARDDRVLKDCVLSSFLVAVITASHHLLAPAGTCRSLFQRSNLYNVLNIIYSTPPTLLSDRSEAKFWKSGTH